MSKLLNAESRQNRFRLVLFLALIGCVDDSTGPSPNSFLRGVDLSYVNQILDKGGVYKEDGAIRDPYQIFADAGANLVRLRLWHNPSWTKEVYSPPGVSMYNDLADVTSVAGFSLFRYMGRSGCTTYPGCMAKHNFLASAQRFHLQLHKEGASPPCKS
jgi:hypothetical protein